jgi:hypothetical protein
VLTDRTTGCGKLSVLCIGLGANLHLAAIEKIDRWIEDHPISRLDSAVHFVTGRNAVTHFGIGPVALPGQQQTALPPDRLGKSAPRMCKSSGPDHSMLMAEPGVSGYEMGG